MRKCLAILSSFFVAYISVLCVSRYKLSIYVKPIMNFLNYFQFSRIV